ncbi:MAG: porin [Armatimonadota bacterium]|nr:MAG: porin [Armatimonadota bacterium]
MDSAFRQWVEIVVVCVLGLLFCAGGVWGETARVGADDWQYQELDALARAGLLSGHPAGPLADWATDLSRYEAASLTLRAVEGVAEAYQRNGEVLHRIAQADVLEERVAPVGVSVTDLARVEKLIEEFRAELVTMGARADDLEAALDDMQQRLGKVEAEQKKHKVDGYVQFRYEDDDAPSGKQQFLVRRARVNVRGPASERASYRIEFQLDAKEAGKARGSKVQLRTAYADYELNRGSLRIGQAKVPWGYELLESSAALWAGERSLLMDRLFPNQRDIGVQWSYRKSRFSPQVNVGIFNGTGINASDNNDRKNVMARVDFPVRDGSLALSGYVGQNGEGPTATDQDRYGVSSRFNWDETELMAEFVTGEDSGYDVRGWYGQVGHPVCKKRPDLLFAKYDQYDEDTDGSDDLFKRWSLGYWYEVDSATRLTLVHEWRKPQPGFSQLSKWDGDATYAEMRVKF